MESRKSGMQHARDGVGIRRVVVEESQLTVGREPWAARSPDPDRCWEISTSGVLRKRRESCSVVSHCGPMDCIGQNTGMGSLSLLQGIFATQGLNPSLLHCKQILYQLSHQGTPRVLEWVAYPFSRGSSRPRNWTGVSCIAGGFFTSWAIRDGVWGNDIEWDVTELLFLGEKTLNNSS